MKERWQIRRYNWVLDVIRSCKNEEHINVAENLIRSFELLMKNEDRNPDFDFISHLILMLKNSFNEKREEIMKREFGIFN